MTSGNPSLYHCCRATLWRLGQQSMPCRCRDWNHWYYQLPNPSFTCARQETFEYLYENFTCAATDANIKTYSCYDSRNILLGRTMGWSASDCNGLERYICEIPSSALQPCPSPPPASSCEYSLPWREGGCTGMEAAAMCGWWMGTYTPPLYCQHIARHNQSEGVECCNRHGAIGSLIRQSLWAARLLLFNVLCTPAPRPAGSLPSAANPCLRACYSQCWADRAGHPE